ncbi:MAG: efflux RND transporter permease subunit [Polyangiaceae bacterium]|nr:efflux RND transporter permease subunit [Polyangiaceae bacterium]
MISYLVRHAATVLLLMVCVLVLGTITYVKLPREANPDVAVPFVMVTTAYPGVSPEDVETLLTVPLENELTGLKDLKEMRSTSAEGVSMISLEFEADVVIEDVLQRVRDRVSRVKPDLPQDAEDTDVREISFSDMPIVILTLGGPVDDVELKRHGERLEEKLKRVPGVLDVKLSGGRTRQIRVQVDPDRLEHYGLSLSDVLSAIGSENVNIPGGDVRAGSANFLVRVPGEFKAPSEIDEVAIKRVGDRPVFVRDVARVVDGFADQSTYSRMNGQPAVSLAVSKRAGANILDVASLVKVIADDEAKRWPEGVSYRALGDQSRFVKDMVSELENNIIAALILVVGVVLFFLGFRNSFFVAIAIPLSMLMAMGVFWALGMTLNIVVLFALILVLGMLVDNAIVLVENIYRHLEFGKTLFEASIDGAKEIAGAVTASTLTTVAAFVPLLFWTGIMGEFMVYLPITVVTVLLSSLIVAVCFLPVITARMMKQSQKSHDDFRSRLVLRAYRRTLEWAIDHRYLTSFAMVAALVVSFIGYGAFNHGTEFFPDVEPDRATIVVRAPEGTDVEATDAIVRQVEAMLEKEPNVEVFVSETGVAATDFSSSAAENQARITVDFLPHPTKSHEGDTPRQEDARLTVDRLRQQFATIVGAEVTIDKERMGPPVGKPVAVEVASDNFHRAGEAAAKVRRDLAAIEGVTDLSDDYRVGRPELRFDIDRGAAKRVGASTQAVASALRTAVSGTKASSFRDGDDEYDIMVEVAPRFRSDMSAIMRLRIPGREDTSPDTFPVPLSAIASYRLAGGSGAIRHVNQNPIVTIEGDVAEGQNENAVRARVVEYIEKAELPEGVTLRLGGANDEQRASQEFLSGAFLVAIFLIAIVLVGQFNRYDLPLIILASVILSLVGVLWGLILTGTAFGIVMTGLGVISLAGVVVNNAIVLLDYVEQLRREGQGVREALIEAGLTRFRPVMLTAITTILGLVPMAIGLTLDFREMRAFLGSQTATWWGPMAVAVIFGLAFATLLTLVVVPTLYAVSESVQSGLRSLLERARALLSRKPRDASAE